MQQDADSHPAPDVGQTASTFGSTDTAIEAAADFERAIAAAERDGPSSDVDPRVHEAMIEAMRSELAVLREQIAARH
jgi:hypothetical protein